MADRGDERLADGPVCIGTACEPTPATKVAAVTKAAMAAALVTVVPALPVQAAEPAAEATPDMAFIEYLGSWEEDDRDWIALAGTTEERTERRPAPAERTEDEERSSDEETG